MRTNLIAAVACATVFASGTAAAAQFAPGSELVGQSAQVQTGGVQNIVYFDPGGAARITAADGTVVPATWSVANSQLCLNTGAAQECWQYASPFVSNQPVTLTSNCQSVSTWTALGTNTPLPTASGERG